MTFGSLVASIREPSSKKHIFVQYQLTFILCRSVHTNLLMYLRMLCVIRCSLFYIGTTANNIDNFIVVLQVKRTSAWNKACEELKKHQELLSSVGTEPDLRNSRTDNDKMLTDNLR